MPGEIFKVHIQPGIALRRHVRRDLLRQPGPGGVALQERLCQRGGKAALLRQRGKMHPAFRAVLPGQRQQRAIAQGQQAALRRKAIGKGDAGGKIGQRLPQQILPDVGIGIAGDQQRALLLLLIAGDQRLPGIKPLRAPEPRIAPPKLQNGDALPQGDGIERVARLDGEDPCGIAHHQRLPRHKALSAHAVGQREQIGQNAVLRGNGDDGLAGLYHMNDHCFSSHRSRKSALCSRPSRLKRPMENKPSRSPCRSRQGRS